MRDKRFVSEHRGGQLKREQHLQLIKWACDCSEHILYLFGENIDKRLLNALKVGNDWSLGRASVGDARKASMDAIAVANENTNPAAIAVARSTGHAVATAHMADHSLGAALYALKAINNAGKSIEEERRWQKDLLPPEIFDLVVTTMSQKEKSFKI